MMKGGQKNKERHDACGVFVDFLARMQNRKSTKKWLTMMSFYKNWTAEKRETEREEVKQWIRSTTALSVFVCAVDRQRMRETLALYNSNWKLLCERRENEEQRGRRE